MKNYFLSILAFLFFSSIYCQSNSWVTTSLTAHETDYFKDISFSDDKNGLAIGIDYSEYNTRYKTVDGGSTWTRQNWTFRGNACIHYNEQGNAITARESLAVNNIVTISGDYASSWSNVGAPTINSQFETTSCWINSTTEYFVAGAGGWGTDDGVYRRKNGAWEHVLENINATKIVFIDDNIGFVGTQYGDLYRTTDSGDNWEELDYPSGGQIDNINALSKDIIYIGEYKTVDGGENWTRPDFTSFLVRYHFFNEAEAYGVAGSDVYATSDGGENWTLLSTNKIADIADEIDCCKKYIFTKDKIFALSNSKPKIYLINIDTTLSTDNLSITDTIKVFPNPTSDTLILKTNAPISSVSIYGINGRLTKKVALRGNDLYNNSLDVSSLAKGIYFLEIQSNNAKFIKRFLKN